MNGFRIGIVGCGGIANRHIAGYRSVAGDLGEVVAGCDPNEEILQGYCDKYAIPHRFTRAEDMIASGQVDVISLLTPPAVRHEVIFPAIEQGIHLLVEKPFGETLADAVSFVEAAEKAGVVLAVNHQMDFTRDMEAIRQAIASGRIGQVRHIAHDHLQNRTRVQGWRSREQRLEISIFSIHLIDRIRILAGSPPTSVAAVMRSWNPDVEGETYTSLNVQFENGTVGTMVSNWHSPTLPECRLRIDGTQGSLLSAKEGFLADKATLRIQPADGALEELDCSQQDTFPTAMGQSMRHLLEAARQGIEPLHSGRGNLQTMQIVDAAYLSAQRGGALVEVGKISSS
ncbi:MAG: gfo/Idh/MocA family oxidoreductase [Candidatus Latescibacteria bacterium]|nr:gfo/Idh/MocA family oxidoreductase [Candidatus Latescibacterota bacterium]